MSAWMWDFEKALAYSEESLAIYERLGDLRGCAHARGIVWRVALFQSNYTRALPLAEENLAALQEVGDKWGSAAAFGMTGIIKQKMGDLEGARQHYEEALRLSNGTVDKEFSNPSYVALYNELLGSLALDNQDLERAIPLFEESVRLYREAGDKMGVGIALAQLSVVTIFQGHYEQARVLNEETISLFKSMGDKSDLAIALWRSGILMLLTENYNEAEKVFKDCLELIQEYSYIPDKQADQATCLEGLAYLAWHEGDTGKAAQLLQAAENTRQKIKIPLVPLERLLQDRFIKAVKEELEDGQESLPLPANPALGER
jgi:tetratricopeptide (TPR) repeat protein